MLHHFAVWAGMPERGRTGPKYNVAPRPLRTGAKGELAQSTAVNATWLDFCIIGLSNSRAFDKGVQPVQSIFISEQICAFSVLEVEHLLFLRSAKKALNLSMAMPGCLHSNVQLGQA